MRAAVVDPGLQPVRNFARNPLASTALGWGTNGPGAMGPVTLVPGGGPFGRSNSARQTLTGAVPAGNFHTAYGRQEATDIPVSPSRRYSCQLWVKPDRDRPMALNVVGWRADNTYPGGETTGTPVLCPAGVWTPLSATITSSAEAARFTLRARSSAVGGVGGVDGVAGEVIELAEAMVVEGQTLPLTHVHGDTPGWRWTGTPGNSESAGYPYTLESIAGAPAARLDAPGTIPLSGETSTRGLALYLVADRLTDTAFWSDTFGVNVRATGDGTTRPSNFSLQQRGTGSLQWQMRLDLGPVNPGFNLSAGGGTALGRHVYTATVPDGMLERAILHDGVVSNRATVIQAARDAFPDGVERSSLFLASGSTALAPVVGLFYDRAHNDETVKRVTAWLARRYGSPVPAGY